jgi:hypothetical protein
MDQSKPKEACEKFEESNKIETSAGTLLNLGQCLEAQGKTGSAFAMYKDAITVGKQQKRQRHVETAEQFIKDLDPRLSRLTIEVPDAVDGLSIVRTDTEGTRVTVGGDDLGVSVPVDPSKWTVEATAPGYQKWSTTVDIEKSASAKITIPALMRSSKDHVETKWKPDAFFIAGTVTAGVGVVGIVVGAYLGAATLNDVNTATSDKSLCPNYACSAKGQSLIDTANTEAAASTATLTIGIAAVAAGGALVAWSLTHPEKTKASAVRTVVVPVVSFGSSSFVGLVVRGTM